MSTDDIQVPEVPDDFNNSQDPFPHGQPGFPENGQDPFPTGQPGFPGEGEPVDPNTEYGTYEDYCNPEICAVVETATSYEALDTNSDGIVDGYAIDTNGDGIQDLGVFKTPDGYWITADTDADGYSDSDSFLTEPQMQFTMPEMYQALQPVDTGEEAPVEQVAPDPVAPTEVEVAPDWGNAPAPVVDENGQLGGDPEDWAAVWFQQAYPNSCVPSSIAQIFDLYTGNTVNEEWFYRRAEELGMWSPIGNTGLFGLDPFDAQTLLAENGIPATVSTLASSGMDGPTYWANLDAEIESGTGVMVMVDSRESVGQNPDGDTASATDHAVLVTDIDEDRGIVTLNDPGRAEGSQMEISIADFQGAWEDSGYAMLMCDQSASEFQATQGAGAGSIATEGDLGLGIETAQADGTAEQPADVSFAAQPAEPAPVNLTELLGQRAEYAGIDQIQPSIGEQIANDISRHGWILLPVAFAVGAAGTRLMAKKAPGA
ncbi:hypothetical protein WJX64_02905 [Leifsonia sp. YIM 134122]|uniref:Peptidase C39-like domain-containing protein n=1 Tax=Leifsonia stereocauli TaxID=3134136 RepID=A0ABU9W0G9_9MICO